MILFQVSSLFQEITNKINQLHSNLIVIQCKTLHLMGCNWKIIVEQGRLIQHVGHSWTKLICSDNDQIPPWVLFCDFPCKHSKKSH